METVISLGLSNNELEDIKGISSLKRLLLLDLDLNNFGDITPLAELPDLWWLSLAYNPRIKDFSPLKHLKSLHSLHLEGTSIEELSPLKDMHALNILNISNTPVTTLPAWMADLFNSNIIFDFDRITDPPREVLEQGPKAIRRYLKRQAKERFAVMKEAKVILVGDGAAGKTSLKMRLLNPKAPLPTGEGRTRGIEVTDWKFRRGYTAHIWDFGGQDVYYPVHRVFL